MEIPQKGSSASLEEQIMAIIESPEFEDMTVAATLGTLDIVKHNLLCRLSEPPKKEVNGEN